VVRTEKAVTIGRVTWVGNIQNWSVTVGGFGKPFSAVSIKLMTKDGKHNGKPASLFRRADEKEFEESGDVGTGLFLPNKEDGTGSVLFHFREKDPKALMGRIFEEKCSPSQILNTFIKKNKATLKKIKKANDQVAKRRQRQLRHKRLIDELADITVKKFWEEPDMMRLIWAKLKDDFSQLCTKTSLEIDSWLR